MDSVLKVFCVHSEPNFSLPWQRRRQYSSTSSGFAIPGHRRILTNAHSVDHFTQVKVRRRGSESKYVAKVLAVGAECDIALLTVEVDEFWKDLHPVRFGRLPVLQDPVTVVGFPIGGDTISVTSGVVSRIEVTAYVHGAAELLGVQIDAAINSGNSGGPAFNADRDCCGIAFQSLKDENAEGIGYLVPVEVIEHFLTDYDRNGRYTGFPCLGLSWQKMENPHMRASMGMKAGQKGVRVRRVEPTAPVNQVLATGDILLAFNGTDIANDGTVPFRSGERISFSYLVSRKYTGDEAELTVMTAGKARKAKVKLQVPARMVPVHIQGQPPPFFILGGLVFTQLTVPYLKSEYGAEYTFDAPVRLIYEMMHKMPSQRKQQFVLLGQVLASDISLGYEDFVNTEVEAVNGHKIYNLEDLVSRVEECDKQYVRLSLSLNNMIILNRKAAQAATPAILAQHCIPKDRSENLQPVLEQ
eukprot:jgi/Astpho2/6135/fgenesh1_pm.00084_%23_26_t